MRTSSILQSALSVSLESEENVELNPVTEETSVAIDEVLEEVREGGEAVEEHEEAVDELEGAAESLESLIASLESAIADGGLSPQAADIHGRAVANAVRRLPVDAAQYVVSTESFGGTGDKLQASMEAMEQAKDLLKKIWEGIKNAVMGAWKAVVNFVATLGKSGEALQRAGAQLKSSASAISGDAKSEKIAVGGAAKYLHDGGEMKDSVAAQLKAVLNAGTKTSSATAHATTELKQLAGRFMTGATEADFQAGAEYGSKVFPGLPLGEKLPGGRELVFDIKALTFKLQVTSEAKGDAEITVPNKGELVAMGNEIVAIGRMVSEFDRKHFANMKKELDSFIAKQDALVKKADYSKEDTAAYRSSLKEFKTLYRMTSSVGPAYMSYAANCAKAAFGIGKRALAAYK